MTQEKCTHPNDPVLVVTHAICTCEVIVEVCPDCGKHLSEPQTDC